MGGGVVNLLKLTVFGTAMNGEGKVDIFTGKGRLAQLLLVVMPQQQNGDTLILITAVVWWPPPKKITNTGLYAFKSLTILKGKKNAT